MKSTWDSDSQDLVVKNSNRIAIVAALFNNDITEVLVRSCVDTLCENGYTNDQVDIYWVPGVWEIPQTVKRLLYKENELVAESDHHRIDGLVTIGCVIRGETSHFEYVAGEANSGLGEIARSVDFPVIFGILTTDTWEQAWKRAAEDEENKGRKFAKTALYMIKLFRRTRIRYSK